MLLGIPALPLADPFVLPLAFGVWFFLLNSKGLVPKALGWTPVRSICLVLNESFRGGLVCVVTTLAAGILGNAVGAVVCGTIAGCGGAFYPLSKGLTTIEQGGVTWDMASSVLAAVAYQASLSLFPLYTQNTRIVCVLVYIVGAFFKESNQPKHEKKQQ
jgi:hypothetical protein